MKHSHFFLSFSAFIFFLLYSSFSLAMTFHGRVEHIDYAKSSSESDLVMFSGGQVGVLPKSQKMLPRTGEELKVRLDKNHRVISLTPLSLMEKELPLIDEDSSQKITAPSSVLMEDATAMFRRMRRNYQNESQCYNRAHIWAYEENIRSGATLMKIFVFYTRRYIRDYNFYWWFHAIPAVYVGNELITLDRRYASRPLSMKPWTDIFVRSRRSCPVITKYSTYKNNQQTEHCYLHFANQYFWQPYELVKMEETGFTKTSWITSQINTAYWEAF